MQEYFSTEAIKKQTFQYSFDGLEIWGKLEKRMELGGPTNTYNTLLLFGEIVSTHESLELVLSEFNL